VSGQLHAPGKEPPGTQWMVGCGPRGLSVKTGISCTPASSRTRSLATFPTELHMMRFSPCSQTPSVCMRFEELRAVTRKRITSTDVMPYRRFGAMYYLPARRKQQILVYLFLRKVCKRVPDYMMTSQNMFRLSLCAVFRARDQVSRLVLSLHVMKSIGMSVTP
jgi:hypothetical protein